MVKIPQPTPSSPPPFSKIPSEFPDQEKDLFFLDFFLPYGNPGLSILPSLYVHLKILRTDLV